MMEIDYMSLCVDLALRGLGNTKSNPMVGAVLVYNHRIIGSGFHEKYGGAHAEINALRSVHPNDRDFIPQSCLYVTLEPCSHYGKTPPCSDAIIRSGIKKVVIGSIDPNPNVSGKGVQKLKNAGIQVTISGRQKETDDLIRPFKAHLQNRPYIILKCVKSRDHFIGRKGEKIWLSIPVSSKLSHLWRSECDGILVGKSTVLTDNPRLTVRELDGRNPTRILIDPNLSCPGHMHIFSSHDNVIVANHIKQGVSANIEHLLFHREEEMLPALVRELFRRHIYTLLVEGGAFTIQKFLEAGLWDEARVIDCPVTLGSGITAPNIEGVLAQEVDINGDTLMVIHRKSDTFPHKESF